MGQDNKHYAISKDGTYVIERSEWEADSEKLALYSDGTKIPDGTDMKIYTAGEYEGGCDYGFSMNGHWYLN